MQFEHNIQYADIVVSHLGCSCKTAAFLSKTYTWIFFFSFTNSEVFRHNLHIIFWSFSSQSSYYILIHSFSSQSSYYILIHSFQLFTILTHSWIIEDKKLNYKVVCYVNIKNCAYIVIFILNPKSQIMRQLQRKTSKHFAFSETFVKKQPQFISASAPFTHAWRERDHRGSDRMVVGFTITYAISTYHHIAAGIDMGV